MRAIITYLCCLMVFSSISCSNNSTAGSQSDTTKNNFSNGFDNDSSLLHKVDSLQKQVDSLQKTAGSQSDTTKNDRSNGFDNDSSLLHKVDLLQKQVVLLQEHTQVSGPVKSEHQQYLDYLLHGVAILALIVSILAIITPNNRRNRQHPSNVQQTREKSTPQKTEAIDRERLRRLEAELRRQMEELGKKISELNERISTIEQPRIAVSSAPLSISPFQKNQFVEQNKEIYFGSVLPSGVFQNASHSDSPIIYFKAQLITEDRAEFRLISLQKVRGYDFVDLAVNFSGVSHNNARDMRTLEPGEARLQQDGKWVITKKTRVERY